MRLFYAVGLLWRDMLLSKGSLVPMAWGTQQAAHHAGLGRAWLRVNAAPLAAAAPAWRERWPAQPAVLSYASSSATLRQLRATVRDGEHLYEAPDVQFDEDALKFENKVGSKFEETFQHPPPRSATSCEAWMFD